MSLQVRSYMGRWRALAMGVLTLAAVAPATAAAQRHHHGARPDSVTIIAGERYRAGDVKQFFLGTGYRDLWVTPIRVPVLWPDTFAGGLELLERGGGRQTLSLRFGTADGRHFIFRSIDKDQSGGFHPDLVDTWVDDIVQDLVSAKHPGGAPVVASLMEAVGLLHADPTIVVLADDPVLGEYREEFAGQLGIFEERPTESEGTGPFAKYERIISSERLLERVVESAEDRVDSRLFLKGRLMDLLIGDWDRHGDQWRWAQVDRHGLRYWLPIPRDRDNAFFSMNGVAGVAGRSVRPFVVRFDATYPDLYGLVYNAAELDRKFLTPLPLSVWDSTAFDLQNTLTDDVIAAAVRRMPEPYYSISGAEIEAKLRSRRDALPSVAREFYEMIATEADLYGTDTDDVVEVERRMDGTVFVRITGEGVNEPLVERFFVPGETREVRLHLLDGDDRVTVTGEGNAPIVVRVIGGDGDDYLRDDGTAHARTIFYDDSGENEIIRGPRTRVDTRTFVAPERDTLTVNNRPPPRDWGVAFNLLSPQLSWRSEIGPVVGVGPRRTTFGFRRLPFASRLEGRLLYAPFHNRVGVSAEYERLRVGSDRALRLSLVATQLGVARFNGFGNDTEDWSDVNRVWWNELGATGEIVWFISDRFELGGGPTVSLIDPDDVPINSPANLLQPSGIRSFGLAGLHGDAQFDSRDFAPYPRHGARIELNADWYPFQWDDAEDSFLLTDLTASYYLPVPFPSETTLALRAGGAAVWGDPPFQYQPWVGGRRSLRGYRTRRFIGDASVFGNAEFRTALGRADLGLAKGDIGTIILGDIGRVFFDGDSPGGWHSAIGGGLWFGAVDRKYTVHVLMASGENLDFYAGIGMPF